MIGIVVQMMSTIVWGLALWGISRLTGGLVSAAVIVTVLMCIICAIAMVSLFKMFGGFTYTGGLFTVNWINSMYSLIGVIAGAGLLALFSPPVAFAVLLTIIPPGAMVLGTMLLAFLVNPMKLGEYKENQIQESL